MSSPGSGIGRRRTNSKSAEDQALNMIAKEAESRLAAKRAERAQARQIRLKELEKQQKELEDKQDRVYEETKPQAAVVTKRAGTYTSSRAGSDDSTESGENTRDLKSQVQEWKDKYRKTMTTNAQLDNEKQTLVYQVDLLKDRLEEQDESMVELQRDFKEKVRTLDAKKRLLEDLQNDLGLTKQQIEQRDKLIQDHGLVIIITEEGTLALAQNPNPTGPVMQIGGAILSDDTVTILDLAGDGTLGTSRLLDKHPPQHVVFDPSKFKSSQEIRKLLGYDDISNDNESLSVEKTGSKTHSDIDIDNRTVDKDAIDAGALDQETIDEHAMDRDIDNDQTNKDTIDKDTIYEYSIDTFEKDTITSAHINSDTYTVQDSFTNVTNDTNIANVTSDTSIDTSTSVWSVSSSNEQRTEIPTLTPETESRAKTIVRSVFDAVKSTFSFGGDGGSDVDVGSSVDGEGEDVNVSEKESPEIVDDRLEEEEEEDGDVCLDTGKNGDQLMYDHSGDVGEGMVVEECDDVTTSPSVEGFRDGGCSESESLVNIPSVSDVSEGVSSSGVYVQDAGTSFTDVSLTFSGHSELGELGELSAISDIASPDSGVDIGIFDTGQGEIEARHDEEEEEEDDDDEEDEDEADEEDDDDAEEDDDEEEDEDDEEEEDDDVDEKDENEANSDAEEFLDCKDNIKATTPADEDFVSPFEQMENAFFQGDETHAGNNDTLIAENMHIPADISEIKPEDVDENEYSKLVIVAPSSEDFILTGDDHQDESEESEAEDDGNKDDAESEDDGEGSEESAEEGYRSCDEEDEQKNVKSTTVESSEKEDGEVDKKVTEVNGEDLPTKDDMNATFESEIDDDVYEESHSEIMSPCEDDQEEDAKETENVEFFDPLQTDKGVLMELKQKILNPMKDVESTESLEISAINYLSCGSSEAAGEPLMMEDADLSLEDISAVEVLPDDQVIDVDSNVDNGREPVIDSGSADSNGKVSGENVDDDLDEDAEETFSTPRKVMAPVVDAASGLPVSPMRLSSEDSMGDEEDAGGVAYTLCDMDIEFEETVNETKQQDVISVDSGVDSKENLAKGSNEDVNACQDGGGSRTEKAQSLGAPSMESLTESKDRSSKSSEDIALGQEGSEDRSVRKKTMAAGSSEDSVSLTSRGSVEGSKEEISGVKEKVKEEGKKKKKKKDKRKTTEVGAEGGFFKKFFKKN